MTNWPIQTHTTEVMRAAAQYTGHGENTGGLQAHSVGDSYPFTVVGTQHTTQDMPCAATRYYVLNCATGVKYYKRTRSGVISTFATSGVAHKVAAHLASGALLCNFTPVKIHILRN